VVGRGHYGERLRPQQESMLHLLTNSLRYRSPACCDSRKELRCTVSDICEPSLNSRVCNTRGVMARRAGLSLDRYKLVFDEHYTVTCG